MGSDENVKSGFGGLFKGEGFEKTDEVKTPKVTMIEFQDFIENIIPSKDSIQEFENFIEKIRPSKDSMQELINALNLINEISKNKINYMDEFKKKD